MLESDRGKPLAGKGTLNRLERTPLEGPEGAYKKIVADPARMDELLLEVFDGASGSPRRRQDYPTLRQCRGLGLIWEIRGRCPGLGGGWIRTVARNGEPSGPGMPAATSRGAADPAPAGAGTTIPEEKVDRRGTATGPSPCGGIWGGAQGESRALKASLRSSAKWRVAEAKLSNEVW